MPHAGLAEYDDTKGIAWRRQSIDGTLMKAPLAKQAVGTNPTDRGRKGSKRHLLVDGGGVPLSLVATGASVNDGKRLDALLSAVVCKRAPPPQRRSKHLCADAGYRGAENLRINEDPGYIPHVVERRQGADAKRCDPKKMARRRVVEVCHSVFNRFRKLLVRYEERERSLVALNHLAAASVAFRKVPMSIDIIYGQVLRSARQSSTLPKLLMPASTMRCANGGFRRIELVRPTRGGATSVHEPDSGAGRPICDYRALQDAPLAVRDTSSHLVGRATLIQIFAPHSRRVRLPIASDRSSAG